jgi:hypothetical protein
MKKLLSFSLFAIVFLVATSCSVDEANDTDYLQESNDSFLKQLSKNSLEIGKRPQPPIWVDCTLYSGIVVPATFKPNSDSFDELYAVDGGTFMGGVPLISDSKPGDKDYNGGRWHLNVLKDMSLKEKYSKICSDEDPDFDAGDFESTKDYFECPLRPINNQ